MTKNEIWKNKKGYTSTTDQCEPREKKQEKSVIGRARKGAHKYNARSRVNNVTTFKNTPQIFKRGMTDTSTTYIGSDYIDKIDP